VPPCWLGGQHVTPHARSGDLLVQLAEQFVIGARVALVVLLLGLGAQLDPQALFVVGLVGLDDGLVVEVPALPALRRPQHPVPLGTRGADRRQGVPARHEHWFGLPSLQVGAPQLDWPDTSAVADGQVADDVAGQRHG